MLVTGAAGSGRTTFGQSLLAVRSRQGRPVHRVTGSPTLSDVPFACLAALTAQVPHLASERDSPADIIAAIAKDSAVSPRTLLLDDAYAIDRASAAAIAQMEGVVELIITTTRISALPEDLQQLAFSHGAHEVHLEELKLEDARILLEDLLGSACNVSTVNKLLNLSGGNPMHLRELAIDARQHGALPLVHGYRTLIDHWRPGGRRLVDLIARRVAGLTVELREAIERFAIVGAVPRSTAERLIPPSTIDQGLAGSLLVATTRNSKMDIAQSFDGPGASAVLAHPEELVQLGAGFTAELVLTTVSSSAFRSHLDHIVAALNPEELPSYAHLHLGENLRRWNLEYPWPEFPERHRRMSGRTGFGAVEDHDASDLNGVTHRAGDATERAAVAITDLVYRGRPQDGCELFRLHLQQPEWPSASSGAKTMLIMAMFLAMMAEGSPLAVYDDDFAPIDWHDVSLDHDVFLAGRGDLLLETGDVAQASSLFAQALAITAGHDRHQLEGFVAGLDAVAATMLGDLERARAQYTVFAARPGSSGGIARDEVERLMLLVIRAFDGQEAARARYEELLQCAVQQDRALVAMRLMHDAWRLRLIEDDEHRKHLESLRSVAVDVQGVLAATLAEYSGALLALEPGHPDRSAITVEALVEQHAACGRGLYAAELAARASEIAARAGDKARSSRLLTLSAEHCAAVGAITTPSLGRARIDPAVLSEREVEVSIRAVQGMSNAEIAGDLYLSPRTVEGHLQRAYAKLGITDRRQLLPPFEGSR